MPPLPPLELSDGTGPAEQATTVRLCVTGSRLHVRFDCEDRDIWSTLTRRDDPLWEEEVVEVFLAPCRDDPIDYYEFEVSPTGVLFDARVHRPGPRREARRLDATWDCPGLGWAAGRSPGGLAWWASLGIPLDALATQTPVPGLWRANLYRIERPRGGPAEFSAWSPTFATPADFHRPERFGVLVLPRDSIG